MARLETGPDGVTIVAETREERQLVAHGAEGPGFVVLLEGYYPAQNGRVLLPAGISSGGAERVREALEEAAASHQEARRRRDGFRLVK